MFFGVAPVGPRGCQKWSQDGPQTAQDGSKMGQDGFKMAQDGAGMAQRWSQDGPKMASRIPPMPRETVTMAQHGPKMVIGLEWVIVQYITVQPVQAGILKLLRRGYAGIR